MRIIIVGQNEQGKLCQSLLGADCAGLVANIQEVPLSAYDAVCICTTNNKKYSLVRYALVNKKHVIVDAPIWANGVAQIEELEHLAIKNQVVLYVARRYRFVESLQSIQNAIHTGEIGVIQHCRLAHVATADHITDGALIDLVPHQLGLLGVWFGPSIVQNNFNIIYKDPMSLNVIVADFYSEFSVELAANYLGISNQLNIEIYGDRDCIFVNHHLEPQDIRWGMEFNIFMEVCKHSTYIDWSFDKWIFAELDRLSNEQILLA